MTVEVRRTSHVVRSRGYGRARGSTRLALVLLAILGVLVVLPLVALVYGAFYGAPPGLPGSLGISGFVEAWNDPSAWRAIGTSFWLAIARTILPVPIAVFLAWAITRTDMPFKRAAEALIVSHIFLPFLPLVMAWAVLGGPRAGLANVLLRHILPVQGPTGPLNIFSYQGLIFVSALGVPTYLYLLISPAFRAVDSSLEESARVAGSNPIGTLVKVTLPLLAPAVIGVTVLAFALALQSFEPELILGAPAGIYVFSTKIYDYVMGGTVPQYGPATALGLVFFVITLTVFVLQSRFLQGRQYTTVSGRGMRVRPLHLPRWRWLVCGVVFLYILLSTVVPFVTLAIASFSRIYGYFGANWFTTENYRELFSNPSLLLSVKNTIIMAGVGAALAMAITFFTSYIAVKTKARGRSLVDLMTWLPISLPGIVLAVGFIWAYVTVLRPPFPFYGTVWILVVAVAVIGLPMGGRVMNGAVVQIGGELEESARVSGGSWIYTMRRVFVPLLRTALLSGWVILFALAMKNFAVVSVLYSPQSLVVAALQFQLWQGGEPEGAAALGVLNMGFALLLVIPYVFLGGRAYRSR